MATVGISRATLPLFGLSPYYKRLAAPSGGGAAAGAGDVGAAARHGSACDLCLRQHPAAVHARAETNDGRADDGATRASS